MLSLSKRERENLNKMKEKLHQREQTSESIANVEPLMHYKHKIGKRVNKERRKIEDEAKKREKISQREEEEAQVRGEDDKTMSIILFIKNCQHNRKIGLNRLRVKP